MLVHAAARPHRPSCLTRAFVPARHGPLLLAAAYELLLPVPRRSFASARPDGRGPAARGGAKGPSPRSVAGGACA